MKTKIIEAAQSEKGPNWGKFLVGRFDHAEWSRPAALGLGVALLPQLGWRPEHLWVMDLQTGEGALFRPGGYPHADLEKHRVWVCPMFEPFLTWLYQQDLSDLDRLPDSVLLPKAEFEFTGRRRPGPQESK